MAAKGEKMNIKLERKRAGLSQIALAHISQIPKYRVQLAEWGFLILSNEEVAKIRRAIAERKSNGI